MFILVFFPPPLPNAPNKICFALLSSMNPPFIQLHVIREALMDKAICRSEHICHNSVGIFMWPCLLVVGWGPALGLHIVGIIFAISLPNTVAVDIIANVGSASCTLRSAPCTLRSGNVPYDVSHIVVLVSLVLPDMSQKGFLFSCFGCSIILFFYRV